MSASELQLLEARLALRSLPVSPTHLRTNIVDQLRAARVRERAVRFWTSVGGGFSLLVALALAASSPPAETREPNGPGAVVDPILAAELGVDAREGQRLQLLLADARLLRIAPPMESPDLHLLEHP